MDKSLERCLDSLSAKYQAEPGLHEEISRKISNRLASFMITPDEFLRLEEVILRHVEETYKRLLITKRHFRQAKKMLSLSQQTTQQNMEKLLQIKTSVDNLKELLKKHKASNCSIWLVKKKESFAAQKRASSGRIGTAEPQDDASPSAPFGFCSN